MKKILITGVTGFIGSNLAKNLTMRGYEVIGITKYSSSRDSGALAGYLDGVKVLTCDITDFHSVYQTIRSVNPDAVIHLAALSAVHGSFEKPIFYTQTNLIGTMNIVHSILDLPDFKSKKLLFASSALVYGIQENKAINEETPLLPLNPYSLTKATMDLYLRNINKIYGLKTTSIRFANTYGRTLNNEFFIEHTISSMLKNEKIYLGNPDTVKDYMYVSDHVNIYINALESDKAGGEAFNAGTGVGVTNKEIVFKLADIIGYDKGNIILGQFPPGYPSRPQAANEPFIILDITKSKRMLGWDPRVSLDEGLKMCVKFWKERIK